MRIIRITEEKLHQVLENAVKNAFNLQENYQLRDKEELMGYMLLKPSHTGLNLNLYVDDGEAYIRDKHPLLLFVEVSTETYIPISVNQTPQVLDNESNESISEEDLLMINKFIITNLDSLVQLSNGQVSQLEFVKNIGNN